MDLLYYRAPQRPVIVDWQVSANSGDANIRKVLQDVFSLSQLAYSAPDRPCRLPLTIKLTDTFLEAIASETNLEGALYGEDDEDVSGTQGTGEDTLAFDPGPQPELH